MLSSDLLSRCATGPNAIFSPAQSNTSGRERGFTLVETCIAMAVLAGIVALGFVAFGHRAGAFETSREQVVAFFAMAKIRAATNGDALGNTGATVVADYEPTRDLTTLRLYEGRPFGGALTPPTPAIEPLVVEGRLQLAGTTASLGSPNLAVFIGTSGAASAMTGYTPNRTTVTAEPACAYDTGIRLPLTVGETVDTLTINCATGEVLPDPQDPARSAGVGGPPRYGGPND